MIETEQQRRWWFATHPEYSWSNRRTKHRDKHEEEEEERNDKVSPEEVDAYVNEALGYLDGPVADFLRAIKRYFGAESESDVARDKRKKAEFEKAEYRRGWNDGYQAIRNNKVPPDLAPEDRSAYARGVREGATTALDEREARFQKWIDPLLMIQGTHPSQILGRNLEKAGEPRPSRGHDAHHLVPERHWRAQRAGDILEKWDIPINGTDNGMWLERRFHRSLHTKEYSRNVTQMLEKAKSRKRALEILDSIRESLSNRKIPK